MKNFLIFLLISKIASNNLQKIEKMTKCLNPGQNINLKVAKTQTTEFSLTFWIRFTRYHNEDQKPFFKLKNISENQEQILTSTKKTSEYDIDHQQNNTHIGYIPFSNTLLRTFEEEDFITKKQIYNN